MLNVYLWDFMTRTAGCQGMVIKVVLIGQVCYLEFFKKSLPYIFIALIFLKAI